ncbi:hypothetical protein SLS56_011260 [Neofusicoccum ribis]|uniref:RiboL-PSP-HEPN domain-containing protein n=1 Tax=Neofusicoccum ribis TaxID=45134 RepID=A0ABR3SC41_9PEZI
MVNLGRNTVQKISPTMRKVSPNSVAFFSNLKEKCNKLLSSKANLHTTERASLQKDVEISLNYARSRHDEVHGRDGLVDQLKNCAYALIEYRLYQDYGDYLAKNLNQLKQPPTDKRELNRLLFKQSQLSWTEIAAHLAREREETRYCDPHDRPATPWSEDVGKAAAIIGGAMKPAQLAWEIEQYASRNAVCHNGIEDLIKNRRPYVLGEKILQDLKELDVDFPADRQEDKAHWRQAIEGLRGRFFTACKYTESGLPLIVPNEKVWKTRGHQG